MWPKHVHAGWKFAYCKTTDHRQATVNWPPTQRQVVLCQSTTDHQLINRFSTDTPTHGQVLHRPTDHQLTNRLYTDPPTQRQVLHRPTDSPTGYPPTHRLLIESIDHQLFDSTKLILTEVGRRPVGGRWFCNTPWNIQGTLKSSFSFILKRIIIVIICLTFSL